ATRRHGNARAAWLGFGIAASIAIVAAGWGTLVIRSNDATAPPTTTVAVVQQDDVSRRALGATLGASGGELLVGAPRAGTADGGPPYTNSYYVVGADGVLDG